MGVLPFLHSLEAMAGAVIVSCCVLAFAAMGPKTRQCFRFVYGVLSLCGLALLALPFAPTHIGMRPWIHAALVAAVAAYLFLDRRRIDRMKPDKGNLGASK